MSFTATIFRRYCPTCESALSPVGFATEACPPCNRFFRVQLGYLVPTASPLGAGSVAQTSEMLGPRRGGVEIDLTAAGQRSDSSPVASR